MTCDLAKHEPVAGRREMKVAQNKEMLIPFLVGIGGGEEGRKQVDKRLAPALTKLAPEGDLAAVAVALRDLLRPGVNDDGQGNIPGREQIVQRPHVLQRPCNPSVNA